MKWVAPVLQVHPGWGSDDVCRPTMEDIHRADTARMSRGLGFMYGHLDCAVHLRHF